MCIDFIFNINKKPFDFTVSFDGMGNFNICNKLGIVYINGYISNYVLYISTHSPEVYYFETELIHTAIKAYNKKNTTKIKPSTYAFSN